ncbi:MAG: S8 family peptidase [Caldilineaceae bacterium]
MISSFYTKSTLAHHPLLHYVRLSYLLLIGSCLSLIWSPTAVMAQAAIVQNPATILVQFDTTTSESDRLQLIATMQGEVVRWLPQINVAEVRLQTETPQEVENMAATAQRRLAQVARTLPSIRYIENNNVLVEGAYTPNDPDIQIEERGYGLRLTHTLAAWDYTTGSEAIIIAVLDTGLALNHPEFAGRIIPGYDFINNDGDPSDDHGHGTHTTGIVAAGIDNQMGMAGVCPQCRILPVKVLNQNNAGTWGGVANGILYATDHGARIINLSLGAAVSSPTMEAAVAYAIQHGVLLVAAAGNMGVERDFYPAALDGVLAVSATDAHDKRWILSNIGGYIDVAAPGSAVYSTYNDLNNYYHGYNYMSGTSMAAPHVTGLAGLLLSQKPTRTPGDLYTLITSTADKLGSATRDAYVGFGRINAERALAVEQDTQWVEVELQDGTAGAGATAPPATVTTPDSAAPQSAAQIFIPIVIN